MWNNKYLFSLLILIIGFVGQAFAATWEGGAIRSVTNDFPVGGYYGASSFFPVNSKIELENLETGKKITVTIARRTANVSNFIELDSKAAEAVGINGSSPSRVRVVSNQDFASAANDDTTDDNTTSPKTDDSKVAATPSTPPVAPSQPNDTTVAKANDTATPSANDYGSYEPDNTTPVVQDTPAPVSAPVSAPAKNSVVTPSTDKVTLVSAPVQNTYAPSTGSIAATRPSVHSSADSPNTASAKTMRVPSTSSNTEPVTTAIAPVKNTVVPVSPVVATPGPTDTIKAAEPVVAKVTEVKPIAIDTAAEPSPLYKSSNVNTSNIRPDANSSSIGLPSSNTVTVVAGLDSDDDDLNTPSNDLNRVRNHIADADETESLAAQNNASSRKVTPKLIEATPITPPVAAPKPEVASISSVRTEAAETSNPDDALVTMPEPEQTVPVAPVVTPKVQPKVEEPVVVEDVPASKPVETSVEPKKVVESKPTSSDKVYIQAGAFATTKAMNNVINKMKNYPLSYEEATIKGVPGYRVLIGPIDQAQVQETMNKLRTIGIRDAFVKK